VSTSKPSTEEVMSHALRVAWTRPSCPSSEPPPSLLAPYNLHQRNQKDHHKAKTKKISVTILTMAAIIIAKNAMLNLSKALIPQPPSLFPNSTPKVSRVCFTTYASKYNKVQKFFQEINHNIYGHALDVIHC
jgi:hypothetical protein